MTINKKYINFDGLEKQIIKESERKIYKKINKSINLCKKRRKKEYYIAYYRKKNLRIIVCDRNTIKCEIYIEFMRPIFRKKGSGSNKNYYFVDEMLGLSPRKRVLVSDLETFVTKILTTYSYKKIINTNNLSIAPSTITNICKSTKFYYKPKKFKGNFKEVFVSIDDMALNTSEKKAFRSFDAENGKWRKIRTAKESTTNAVIFTGYKPVHEPNKNDKFNRRMLENKTYVHFPRSMKSEDKAAHLEDLIKKIYGIQVKKSIFLGDGAKNITEISQYFEMDTERYIDSFHFLKRLRKYLALGWKNKLEKEDFANFSKDSFKNYLIYSKNWKLIDNNGVITKKGYVSEEKLKKNSDFQYLLKWFSNWKKGFKNGYISPIEGIQGNYLAEIFKRKRKFCQYNRELLISFLFAQESRWEISSTPEEGYFLHSEFKIYDHNREFILENLDPYVDPHGVKSKFTPNEYEE